MSSTLLHLIAVAVHSNMAWLHRISRLALSSSCRPGTNGDLPICHYEAGGLPRPVGPSTCPSSNQNTPAYSLLSMLVFYSHGSTLTPTSCAFWRGSHLCSCLYRPILNKNEQKLKYLMLTLIVKKVILSWVFDHLIISTIHIYLAQQ